MDERSASFHLDVHRELRTGQALVGASQATSRQQFQRAIRRAVAGFNFIYADDHGNIGYWHTGRVPIRAPGVDPRLPTPGDGRFDWRGFLSPKRWPSVIDPAQGFVASWNNKPQRSWPDSGDGTLWGAYQRARQPMRLLAGSRRLDQAGLWHVARRTGELGLRAALGFKGKPTGNVAGAGFPILTEWFRALERVVASHVFGPVVPGPDPAAGVQSFTRTSSTTSPEFEFFADYDAFVYDVMAGRTANDYLGGRSVWQASRAALDRAIAVLRKHQGSDPAKWRARMPRIRFFELDVSGVPSIPWENRGTWGQAVAFRPAASAG